MTTTHEHAVSRTPIAAAHGATTPDCSHLHNAFGPGCPYCAPAPRSTWTDHALCAQADPEAWFPEKGERSTAAKVICRRCPVRRPCLLFALATGQAYGVWGGLSTPERDRLLLERAS